MAGADADVRLTTSVGPDDWDSGHGSWRCSALTLPSATLERAFANGQPIDPDRLNLDAERGLVRWLGSRDDVPAKVTLDIVLRESLITTEDADATKALAEEKAERWKWRAVLFPAIATVISAAITAWATRADVAHAGALDNLNITSGGVFPDSFALQMREALQVKRLADPYGITTLAQLIRLERAPPGKQPWLTADWRMVYGIHAIRPFLPTDKQFIEFAHATVGGAPTYVPGSHPEVLIDALDPSKGNEVSWYVQVGAGAGGHRTIVTGSQHNYFKPLTDGRRAHNATRLGADEDEFCYPNDGSDDTIGETVILVESNSLKFKDPGSGTRAYLYKEGVSQAIDPTVRSQVVAGGVRSVASAQFPRILDHQDACLVVSW